MNAQQCSWMSRATLLCRCAARMSSELMCVCISWRWCLALCADEAWELAVRVRLCRYVFAD